MQVWIELDAWERALYPDVLQPEIKPFTTERLDHLKVARVLVRLIIETLSHELEHSNENITSTISAQMSGFTCWLCLSLCPGHCSPLLLLFPALLDRLRSQKVIIFPYRSLSLKCFFFFTACNAGAGRLNSRCIVPTWLRWFGELYTRGYAVYTAYIIEGW